ncbi:hypothetical protein VTP01DRAFT_1256 [Rhizomucor pusillus]|uniref:uncharacterized protein n=1 Tax=Rhizomucor pusillus TaxID=4840 RepID=UPI0037436001
MKYELAKAKRARKQEEKAKLQEEKQAKKKDSGQRRVCPTCKGTDHSRSSNKKCSFYKPKRQHATELERTSIIKTTLKNICKEERFVNAVQKPIEHFRDITYVGSVFATPESIKTAFKTFKSQIPAFDAKRFRSKGFMTLISQAAQEYEENIGNHITANMVKKTQEYIFVRLTDENDEFFITATVSEKKALADHVCAVLKMEPGNEINIPKFIKDYDKLAALSERIIKLFNSLKQSVYDSIRKQEPLKLSKSFTRPLPEESMEALQNFVTTTQDELKRGCFNPPRYTDPKDARRFSILPLYTVQKRHVLLNNQAFAKIMYEIGPKSNGSPYKADDLHEAFFNLFYTNAPRTNGRDKIRTDGYDVEFIFKKLKRPPPKVPLEPADINSKFLKEATIWGVDPGLTDISVAADEFYR